MADAVAPTPTSRPPARAESPPGGPADGTTLRRPADLVDAGLVTEEEARRLAAVTGRYALAIPPTLARRIDRDAGRDGDRRLRDPIARQLVPHPEELETTPEERADPIGDGAHSPLPGLVHRYPDRVLLQPVLVCPLYCRFCFRREAVGPGGGVLTPDQLDAALAYIADHPEIWEVILTGGDPLVLSPRRLEALLGRLAAIPHLGALRIHSRVPVATPERLTPEHVAALGAARRRDPASPPVTVAVHSNHPRELGPEARAACARLADAGVPLLGQTVLLAGVNDDPEILAKLFRTMTSLRIQPYYLHHPDLAPGTARFRLDLDRGRALHGALRGRLPGRSIPTYVLDIPGGHGKVPVTADHVTPDGPGRWRLRDPRGRVHRYPPVPGRGEPTTWRNR